MGAVVISGSSTGIGEVIWPKAALDADISAKTYSMVKVSTKPWGAPACRWASSPPWRRGRSLPLPRLSPLAPPSLPPASHPSPLPRSSALTVQALGALFVSILGMSLRHLFDEFGPGSFYYGSTRYRNSYSLITGRIHHLCYLGARGGRFRARPCWGAVLTTQLNSRSTTYLLVRPRFTLLYLL